MKPSQKKDSVFSVFFNRYGKKKKTQGNRKKSSTGVRNRPGQAVAILGVVAILLVLLLYAVSSPTGSNSSSETSVTAVTSPEMNAPDNTTAQEAANYVEPETATKTAKNINTVSAGAEKETMVAKTGVLYFIIDDVGNSMDDLERFLEIPIPLTFAVMPGRIYSSEAAEAINAAGRSFIIHQPMEAVGGADPGSMAIYSSMTSEEIRRIVRQSISQLPNALGMNNHMGSKITSDKDSLTPVLSELKSSNMIFIDSVTTGQSIAENLSREIGLVYAKRNSMFLDNEPDREMILENIESGKRVSGRDGYAVMIGHVWSAELADLLLELYPTLIEDGYELKDVRDLIVRGSEQ